MLEGGPSKLDVTEKVAQLISEIASIPIEAIHEGATLENDLKMESVRFVEVQVAIEDTYQIEVDPIRVVELNEFGAIADYIYSLLSQ